MGPTGMRLSAAFVMLFTLGDARAQQVFAHGIEESCAVDTDGDRLVNCQEVARLTDYTDPDTDNDGLGDGDEVLGTLAGLDLPALGVDPRRKDLLVEIDWTDDAFECAPHTHRPADAVVEEVRTFYALLPLANPDGSTGVNYIADYGQGGPFTGGEFVDTGDGVVSFDELTQTHWPVRFATNRRGYFRYSMHAHRWAYGESSSGLGLGDFNLVTLNCAWSVADYDRNTMIHELGHNFGLRHGANEACNDKPNYNSLMNYRYQFDGLDAQCRANGDGRSDGYSVGNRLPIDEARIDEMQGVCGGPAIDWNANGNVESGIAFDINPGFESTCGGSALSRIEDFDDWSNITLLGTLDAQNKLKGIKREATCAGAPVPHAH